MTPATILEAAPRVNPPRIEPAEFFIGLAVICRTADWFNGKAGTITKIVRGNHLAFYAQLDDATFKDLLYFAASELEAQGGAA